MSSHYGHGGDDGYQHRHPQQLDVSRNVATLLRHGVTGANDLRDIMDGCTEENSGSPMVEM